METPSVMLIGPGAIGCSLAGGLIEAGHTPTLVARTPFDQLRAEWPDGELVVDVTCIRDVADVALADVVIVATKATQNADVFDIVQAATRAGSILVVAQNGVDHTERFASVVEPEVHVVPAVPMLPCRRKAPGHVVVGSPSFLSIPAGPSAAVVQELFGDSHIGIDATDDWITSAWFKLMLNAASGGIGVLTRRGSEVMSDEGAQELMLALMEEVAAVGRAEGANLATDLPTKMTRRQAKNAGAHTSSIVLDRLAGTPTEWRERNEAVVRSANKHGIKVPLNKTVTTLMRLGEPR